MKQIELVMVTPNNNNKYYKMKENSDNTFTAIWGRVGSSENTMNYPIEQWEKKYNEKIKKGYKDITSLKSESATTVFKDITDKNVANLLNTLQKYSKQAIIQNYTVSSEQVTQNQIDKAQEILDELATLLRKKMIVNSVIDEKLTDLYTVIPRKMKKVQDFILNGDGDKNKAKQILQREQDSIDNMRGQVAIQNTKSDKDEVTLEDVLGVKIKKVDDDSIINQIKDLMQSNANQLVSVFEVIKTDTQKAFDKQRNKSIKHWTKLLWHGSRNENWLNILKTGLKIRPTCAVQTGAMFGNGCYFADKCQKSVGYTSLKGSYWASGSSRQAFLALYDVNTGMEYRIQQHTSDCYYMDYSKLKSKGDYDSLFAKGGIDLRNNEYIVYKESQCTIKYLVEIGE
jgi:poly [ADP-ribose] polymerase